MLKGMTPLWGTKHSSALVGDKSGGDRRAARSPLSCALSRCGAAWGGYGAAWAATVPRAGNTAGWVFTSHESRNMFFPCPPATPRRATPSPTNGFSRITRPETRLFFESRLLCFSRITASLPTISHHFPAFPGISRPPHPPPPIKCPRAVSLSWSTSRTAAPPGYCFPERCGAAMERHERHIAPEPVPARRQPQLSSPCGLVPLRPALKEPMLRKRNVLSCIDTRKGRAYHILSFVHLGGRS